MNETSLFSSQPVFLSGTSFDLEEDNRFMLELHKHDANSEILLIEEGEGEFEIDGVRYTAEAGTLLLYHRGIWHKELSTKHPFRATYIGFTGIQLRELPPDFFIDPRLPPVVHLHDQLPAIRKLMRECIAEYYRGEPESTMIANHYLGILFAKLARLVHYGETRDKMNASAQEAVWKAKRMMEENYSAPITLEMLAEETFLNKYHLAHLFKDIVGISPIQFLIYCRIEAAKRYLKTTTLQVKQIAELVGYQSEPSFYHAFMRASGVTPGGYREQG
ncbi:helix-turn-helix transcriptional regulator [Paenibacillus solisilvae]|uniref:Helix-turn-helix transcriptional regulator n=1 Tax=Paenibacillus solisilvae TaxID=2486751 RepID=A0ABW0VXV0_9BACL